VDALTRATASEGAPVLIHAPIVTMKIASVKGRPAAELLRYSRGRRDRDSDRRAEQTNPGSGASAAKDSGVEGNAPAGGGAGSDRVAAPAEAGKEEPIERMPGWTLRREYRSTYRG